MLGDLFETEVPIVAAPMAGGATTVELVNAVTDAGGFGFLAGGYKTPAALADEIASVRLRTSSFGVNLFVPGVSHVNGEAFAEYARRLEPEAAGYGLELDSVPHSEDDAWDEKLTILCSNPVPVVSVTFGLPSRADISRLRGVGSSVLASVTNRHEAQLAEEAGVDGLVVQGASAGGHSAIWNSAAPLPTGTTLAVLQEVRSASSLPIVAAGGVDGPEAVIRLLAGGAQAVGIGTLLLRTDEAGTSATHRAALADPQFEETIVTRAFTGRPARALRNAFIDRYNTYAIDAYPEVHHLTKELRKVASAAGDSARSHLWAGAGYRSARTGPARDTVEWLASLTR